MKKKRDCMHHKQILILTKDPESKSYKPTSCPCKFHCIFSLLIDVSGPHNFEHWISPENQYVFSCRTALTQLVKDNHCVTIYSVIDLDQFQQGNVLQKIVISHVDFIDLLTAWGNALQQEPENIFLIAHENGSIEVTTQLDLQIKYLQTPCDCNQKRELRKDAQGNFIVDPRLKQRLQELNSEKKGEEFKINQITFFPKNWSPEITRQKIEQIFESNCTPIILKNRFGIITRRTLLAKTDDNIELQIVLDADWNVMKAYPLDLYSASKEL